MDHHLPAFRFANPKTCPRTHQNHPDSKWWRENIIRLQTFSNLKGRWIQILYWNEDTMLLMATTLYLNLNGFLYPHKNYNQMKDIYYLGFISVWISSKSVLLWQLQRKVWQGITYIWKQLGFNSGFGYQFVHVLYG